MSFLLVKLAADLSDSIGSIVLVFDTSKRLLIMQSVIANCSVYLVSRAIR